MTRAAPWPTHYRCRAADTRSERLASGALAILNRRVCAYIRVCRGRELQPNGGVGLTVALARFPCSPGISGLAVLPDKLRVGVRGPEFHFEARAALVVSAQAHSYALNPY
jgi:hypothetical protein